MSSSTQNTHHTPNNKRRRDSDDGSILSATTSSSRQALTSSALKNALPQHSFNSSIDESESDNEVDQRLTNDREESPLFEVEEPTVDMSVAEGEPSRPKRARFTSSNSSEYSSMSPLMESRTYDITKGRAYAEKRKIIEVRAAAPGKFRKQHLPEHDPDNQLIKTLRADQKLSWQEIADILNEQRKKDNLPANLTSAAVYGRFVRNAPRVARLLGEGPFDPKDYMYYRAEEHKKAQKNMQTEVTKWTPVEDELLVECYKEVEELFWGHVAHAMNDKTGRNLSEGDVVARWNIL